VGSPVGRRGFIGGKDLWNRCVLSLEWKREEVMDDERGWRNEAGRLFQGLGDAYWNKRSVILSEEDEGGRAMVMRDDERVRPGG